MNDRTRDPEDPFDLGESSVQPRAAPPGRGWGRIVLAGILVALGLLFGLVITLLFGMWSGLAVATLFCGLGFAIYDYVGPFGPRPGRRPKSGRGRSEREVSGSEDY
jgi:predicted lipid-binding transport protein (Tim44 family)